MNKIFLTAVTGLLISGCSAVRDDSRYVNTAMFSAVSDGAAYTVTASGLGASQSSQHVIQYSLRPNPGTGYRDKLDRLYATALMNINLSKTSAGALVQVRGEIRYYDTEHYDNGKLTGDILQTILLTAQSIRLERNKPVTIPLPRDTLFVIELSTEQKMLNPALMVIPAAYKPAVYKPAAYKPSASIRIGLFHAGYNPVEITRTYSSPNMM